jgi:hypothetical protein
MEESLGADREVDQPLERPPKKDKSTFLVPVSDYLRSNLK